MAIVMLMEWPGKTMDDYGAVMTELRLDENPPEGGICHVAGQDGSTLRIHDVWDSEDAWNSFLSGRLMPAIQAAGLSGQPNVRTYPVGNVYVPDAATLEALGTASPA